MQQTKVGGSADPKPELCSCIQPLAGTPRSISGHPHLRARTLAGWAHLGLPRMLRLPNGLSFRTCTFYKVKIQTQSYFQRRQAPGSRSYFKDAKASAARKGGRRPWGRGWEGRPGLKTRSPGVRTRARATPRTPQGRRRSLGWPEAHIAGLGRRSRVGKTPALTSGPAGGSPARAAARRLPGRWGGRSRRPLAERTEAPGQNTGRSGPQRAGRDARTARDGRSQDP